MKLSPQRKDGETFKKYQKRRAICDGFSRIEARIATLMP